MRSFESNNRYSGFDINLDSLEVFKSKLMAFILH